MNNDDYSDIQQKLRAAFPRTQPTDPPRDLWPALLAKLADSPPPVRVPWFDWALGAAVAAALFFFPALIPALLYHF